MPSAGGLPCEEAVLLPAGLSPSVSAIAALHVAIL